MIAFSIRAFTHHDAAAFEALNRAWIEEHFALEETDRQQIGDPQGAIIDKGGFIAIGEGEGRVVATGGIKPVPGPVADGRCWMEVVKMATDPAARGRGLGGAVLERLLAFARERGAHAVWLETNDRLAAALRLYRRHGFTPLAPGEQWPTPYSRCNLQMMKLL